MRNVCIGLLSFPVFKFNTSRLVLDGKIAEQWMGVTLNLTTIPLLVSSITREKRTESVQISRSISQIFCARVVCVCRLIDRVHRVHVCRRVRFS